MMRRGPLICSLSLIFLTFSWITWFARCWVRLMTAKPFKLDDWLILGAVVHYAYPLLLRGTCLIVLQLPFSWVAIKTVIIYLEGGNINSEQHLHVQSNFS